MIYEEIVQMSSLEKKKRAEIKTPGYVKGPVRIRYCDDAVEGVKPWHTRHEDTCVVHANLTNYRRRNGSWPTGTNGHTDWYEHRNSPDIVKGGCTCTRPTNGFYAVMKIERPAYTYTETKKGGVPQYAWIPAIPIIWRFAPRPFTIENAVRFGELKDDQETRVLADNMLERGHVHGELLAKMLFKAKQPKL